MADRHTGQPVDCSLQPQLRSESRGGRAHRRCDPVCPRSPVGDRAVRRRRASRTRPLGRFDAVQLRYRRNHAVVSGRFTQITEMPDDWKQELAVAVAGPVVSVVLGAICYEYIKLSVAKMYYKIYRINI
jgi:hypothetical protein